MDEKEKTQENIGKEVKNDVEEHRRGWNERPKEKVRQKGTKLTGKRNGTANSTDDRKKSNEEGIQKKG